MSDSTKFFSNLFEFIDLEIGVISPAPISDKVIAAAGVEYQNLSIAQPEFRALSACFVDLQNLRCDHFTKEFFEINRESVVVLAEAEYAHFKCLGGLYCTTLKTFDKAQFHKSFPFA